VRPLRLVVFVISSPPSVRLSPEGSRLLSYLRICISCCRACMHGRYFHCVCQPPGAGPYLSIWLLYRSCPSRSSRYLCVVMFWSYLAITGDAPFGHLPMCYGPPASPLLSRTPITKYNISPCKVSSMNTVAPQQGGGRPSMRTVKAHSDSGTEAMGLSLIVRYLATRIIL
jgi:hypothetical protein